MSNDNLGVTSARQRPSFRILGRANSSATASSASHSRSSISAPRKSDSYTSSGTTPDMGSLYKPPSDAMQSESQQTSQRTNRLSAAPSSFQVETMSDAVSTHEGSSAWKLEFRGVVKLVRWMSTKGSKSATAGSDSNPIPTDQDTQGTRPQKPAKLLRRSTTSRFASRSKRALSSATFGDPETRPVSPPPSQAPAKLSRRATAGSSILGGMSAQPPQLPLTTNLLDQATGNLFTARDERDDAFSPGDAIMLNSDASQSQGSGTIRAGGCSSGNEDTDVPSSSTGHSTATHLSPPHQRSRGKLRRDSKGRRTQAHVSSSAEGPSRNVEVVSGASASRVSPPLANLPLLPSPALTSFLHQQGASPHAVSSQAPRVSISEGMTYVGAQFTHNANNHLPLEFPDRDDRPLVSPSTTAASDHGGSHTPSIDATLVGHLQTHSDIGHGPTSSLSPRGHILRSQSVRSPPFVYRTTAPPAPMARKSSIGRSDSSGSRKKTSLRRKKSTGAMLKDRLKRSFTTQNNLAVSTPLFSSSFFSRSKTDLRPPPAKDIAPPVPPKDNRGQQELKKRPSVIPETSDRATNDKPPTFRLLDVEREFGAIDLSLPNPPTSLTLSELPAGQRFADPSDILGQPRSLSPLPRPHFPNRTDSDFSRAENASAASAISLPQKDRSTATLPTTFGRSPSGKRRLVKKRGGSLDYASADAVVRKDGRSNSFLSSLAGAFAGLSMTSLPAATSDSQPKVTPGKLQKSPKQQSPPPPAWRYSDSPSPNLSSPPSPITPYYTSPSQITPSSLASEKKSSSFFSGSKSSKRTSFAPDTYPSSSSGKLRKKKSSSVVDLSSDIPPVPSIPEGLTVAPALRSKTTGDIPRPPVLKPTDIIISPPLVETDAHRHPLTSLAYTGRQSFYSNHVVRSHSEGKRVGDRGLSVVPTGTFEEATRESFHSALTSLPIGDSALSVEDDDPPASPGLLASIPPSYLYTSPSSPVGFADQRQRRSSMYDSLNGDEAPSQPTPRPARPNFVHRPTSNSAKRWTIAVNHIADDVDFLKEIDDLRKTKAISRRSRAEGTSPGGLNSPTDDMPLEVESDEEVVWMKARRAMLCVREIMRTEASYRRHLTAAYEAESTNPSSTAPSAVLIQFPALISASTSLSSRLEEDPSAWGVSSAFLGVEDELENALVPWCGVVGQVMMELASGGSPSVSAGSRASQYYRKYSVGAKDSDKDKAPKRTDTAGSSGSSNAHSNVKPVKSRKDKSRPSSVSSGTAPVVYSTSTGKPLSLQDVAIMPSQRIPRYVLLFKDLLQQTPITSPSRALVERALGAAMRIAKTCDEAQQDTYLLASAA